MLYYKICKVFVYFKIIDVISRNNTDNSRNYIVDLRNYTDDLKIDALI